MKISDKYLAGFIDADGHIGVALTREGKTPQLHIDIAQKDTQDEVIYRIHEEFGGSICERATNYKDSRYTTVHFPQRQAKMLLNRIGQHLVVKRHFANVALELCNRCDVLASEHEKVKEYLKVHRHLPSLPIPKHPTRGWTAGYLDGDGCLSVTRISTYGRASLLLHVAAEKTKVEGLQLLQKAYGGNIFDMCEGRVRQYTLALPASKVLELSNGILEKMIVKKDQLDLLRRCAEMGHFRDGENIKAALKHLKAHPHRLNEPKPDMQVISSSIRDLPEPKRAFSYERDAKGKIRACTVMRQSDTCTE